MGKKISTPRDFIRQIADIEPLLTLLNHHPNTAFCIKDRKARIMVINKQNCEICNIPSEEAAFGKTGFAFLPRHIALQYHELDMRVIKTGKPVLNSIVESPNITDRLIINNKVPLFDKRRKVIGVAVMYHFVDYAGASPLKNRRLAEVASHIHTHYSEPLTNERLAAIAHLSVSQFKRIFRRIFSMSPSEYVIQRRVNAACELLETTDRTVSDIAVATGFYDQSHLNRTFKRVRGCTPSRYRGNRSSSSSAM